MEPEELIKLRLQERDKEFSNLVRAFLRDEAGKGGGVGLSGNIIAGGYNILVEELKLNVEIICAGFKDSLVGSLSRNATKNYDERSESILVRRKEKLEELYKEGMNSVLLTAKKETVFEEYFRLDEVFELQLKELSISISKIDQEYQNALGKTLLDRVKNEFKNRPFVVVSVVTMLSVSTFFVFLKAIGCCGL